MKKLLISSLVIVVALTLFYRESEARIFTLDQSDLAKVWEVWEDPGGGSTYLGATSFYYPIEDGYQFWPIITNRFGDIVTWNEMAIGSVLFKTAGFQWDTLVEIGGDNLQNYDEFSMIFSGTTGWWITLFVETGYSELGEPNNRYFAEWVLFEDEFTPDIASKSVRLTLDLTDIPYLNHVTSLGWVIGRDLGSQNISAIMQAYPVPTIDAVLKFFDDSVADGSLKGYGHGNSANNRLNALRAKLQMASDLIDIGDIDGACIKLDVASEKCDDHFPPPDFVAGDAVSTLYGMIVELTAELGCE